MYQLKTLALADIDHELAASRRVLNRVPADKLAWAPHAKSMSLGNLAAHIVNITGWQVDVLTKDGLDFGTAPPPIVAGEDATEIRRVFESHAASIRPALDAVDESAFSDPWTLQVGDRVLFTRPRIVVLRAFCLSHIAHHRGQLTVYLRLLDVPVPSVYGPTADEP